MADDNHFSLGDILWEYADYTPPETPAGPSVPLPPEAPQAPKPPAAAPAKPGITSPAPGEGPRPGTRIPDAPARRRTGAFPGHAARRRTGGPRSRGPRPGGGPGALPG